MFRRTIVAVAVVAISAAAFAQQIGAGWIDSPEAYFATNAERIEWARISSDADRAAFVERFWLKRDPTPGTPQNEFQEAIVTRIARANDRFALGKTPGAQTARGMIWVVFGPPSRLDTAVSGPAERPPLPGGQPRRQDFNIVENTVTFTYDRQRTPRLLEMVNLPSLEINVLVKPQQRVDELQTPGLAMQLRETLARRSIVNDIAPPVVTATLPAPRLDAAIPEGVGRALDEAAPPSFADPNGFFSAATYWRGDTSPTVVWFATTRDIEALRGGRFFGRVRSSDGKAVATFAEPLTDSREFSFIAGGHAYALRLTLPPGDHTGQFAVTDEKGAAVVASSTIPLHVRGMEKLAVSSVFVSAAPVRPTGGNFDFGKVAVIPRADALFNRGESVWLIGEVRAADPKNISIEARVRNGAKTVGTTEIELDPTPMAPNVYLFVREIPLAAFEPADYAAYVIVKGPGNAEELRRADFRVLP